MSPTWLGQQLAQLARHFVLHGATGPMDVTVGDMRLRCHPRTNNCEKKFVFMPWRYDPVERDALRGALPPDGVFLDIGANVGIYTLTAALHLGSRGRVLALEPNPDAFRRLRFNVKATRQVQEDWPRIELEAVAVGRGDENRQLVLDPRNLGGGQLMRTAHDTSKAKSVTVECRSLLGLLEQRRVARIDVLKIDIEGAEDEALIPFFAAAPRRLRPTCILIENSEAHWRQDLPGTLARNGYLRTGRTRRNSVYRMKEGRRARTPQ